MKKYLTAALLFLPLIAALTFLNGCDRPPKNNASGPPKNDVERTARPAMYKGNAGRTGAFSASEAAGRPEVKWRFQPDIQGPTLLSTPAVAGDSVFIAGSETFFYAVDVFSGELKWKFRTGGDSASSPAFADGKVFFSSSDNLFYALESKSGALAWEVDTGWWGTESDPVVAGNTVYIGGGQGGSWESEVKVAGHLFALDIATGKEKWRFATGGEGIDSDPAVAKKIVYFRGSDNYLYAVDADKGREKWRTKIDTANELKADPVVSDNLVLITTQENLLAFAADTGTEIWRLPGKTGAPAIIGGVVYVGQAGADTAKFTALEAKTGNELWATPLTDGGDPSFAPAGTGAIVYYYQGENLYAFARADGRILWTFKTKITSPSLALADRAIFFAQDNELVALE